MSSIISNDFEERSDRSPESKRKKRRRIDIDTVNPHQSNNFNNNHSQIRWRSATEQQTYSSKLLEALRHVRHRNSSPAQVSGSRAVREAADKALAIAARGRSRWSRAIMTNRLKLRLKNHKKAKIRSKVLPPPPLTGSFRLSGEKQQQKLPALEKRVKFLGRLVPGCRKLSFPNLLEETTDYIAALQMQVRAMAALAELLTGSTAGSMEIESSSSSGNPVHMS